MRLFTGIDLPDEVRERLGRLISTLRTTAHLKWSPVSNLHITAKFIGEWPEENLNVITSALQKIPRRDPFPIAISGLGWFPNPHNPRVFWAGVHGGEPLKQLAGDADAALVAVGVAAESREYSPHLTLARVGQPGPLQPIRQAVANLESTDFGEFTADRFHLYLSKTGPAGSAYTQLATFPFAA